MAGRRGEGVGSREEFWREHVGRWEKSGQSVRGYCRAQELSEPGFHFWKRELKRREERGASMGNGPALASAKPPAQPGFAEVRLAAAQEASGHDDGSACIEIVCGTSRRVQVHPGFDEETLARVLTVLERAAC